ncbi:glycosyltransferase family 29 protein [Thalassobius sp. S69A]|uniref:glycosyltransferase family 29 protein n=1 Tax=unclassified Thalassovita TaxID=2619711 RepID=UPI000C0F2EE9|nr:hypothetical protein [Paracoccaceae bacterium]MBT26016.1 hypothetical protein [Paracoccaceae bacterium]
MTDTSFSGATETLRPSWQPSDFSRTKLGFLLARSLRDEGMLSLWSESGLALTQAAQGARIAVVGNARSLSEKTLGAQIDNHDIVLRLNTAPMPDPRSHGRRTDWLASSIPVPQGRIDALAPSRVLWMTRKRKRLPFALAQRSGFYLNPQGPVHALAAQIGAPPSTGAMVLDLVRRLPVTQVSVFGFDFFASLSHSGRRTAARVPHDFAAERDHAMTLFQQDARFKLY